MLRSKFAFPVTLTLLATVMSGTAIAQTPLPKVDSSEFATTPLVLPNGLRGELVKFESANPVEDRKSVV